MRAKFESKITSYEQKYAFKLRKHHLIPILAPIVILLLALPLVLSVASSKTSSVIGAQAAAKPDIVVVMVDDLGSVDDRILNKLPNVKSLWLDNGLKFDNAYNETPLCCPGRAAFLTGQHIKNHGVTHNDARLLNPSFTVATAMHSNGYWTIAAGKYLNGANLLSDKTPPGWDRMAMLLSWKTNVSSSWAVQDKPLSAGYMDRFTADKSLEWLKNAPKSQPLFMWVNPHAPHNADATMTSAPWEPNIEQKYLNDPRCKNIALWKPPSYAYAKQPNGYPLNDICRSLLTVDDTVGALRAEMARQGRNPIWIFTTDNGMSYGKDGFPLKNVPQSDNKTLYFAGPNIPHGVSHALISDIDLGPTIADLGGTSMPKADGISFASIIHSINNNFRTWMLEDHPEGGGTGGTPAQTGPWWGIRTPQYHLVEWAKWRGEALYDTFSDPWEKTSIASANPSLVDAVKNLVNTNPLITPTPTPTDIPTPTDSPTPTLMPTPTVDPNATPTPTLTALKAAKLTTATALSTSGKDDSVYVSETIPDTMTAGKSYPVSVTMKNTGTSGWTKSGKIYKLASQHPLLNAVWGKSKINVPVKVTAGNTVTFIFNIVAPKKPGFYSFQWRMIKPSGVAFGKYSPNLIVNVNSASVPKVAAYDPKD